MKMLMRMYGRKQHALWGSTKVDRNDARGLSARQARRTQRRREKREVRRGE